MREKFQSKQTVNIFRKIYTVPKATKINNNNNNNKTSISPSYTFSLAGKIIVYTPIQGTKREKYFNLIIYRGKMPTLAGKNTSPSISSFINRVFSTFRRKKYGSTPSQMDTKVVIPTLTQQ